MRTPGVAWITGAGSGIGRACARELARRGADVAVSGRRRDRLEEIADEIRALGRRALVVPCDVTDEDEQQRCVAQIVAELGKLDIAIANAGISVGGLVADLTAEEWRRQLDCNVVGAAITARFAIPELRKNRGRLALVGSVTAFIAAPGFGAYHASKHAVRALGQTLSAELSGTGVSCTTLHPGFVDSEISKKDAQGNYDPARRDPRPQYLMWDSDRAARVMIDAIAKRRRELVFTGHGKAGAFLGMHLPWLSQLVFGSDAMRAQAARFKEPP